MSQKESAKKQEPLFEEEKDFYLSYLNKKMRNSKKKLEQIDELLKKDPETLKPEQMEKINARDEVLQSVKHFEDLKKLYYTAYKSALEEGKEAKPKSVEKTDQKTKKPTETNNLEDAIKKVLELLAFSQISNNQDTELQQFCNSVLNFTSKSTSTLEERIQQSLQHIQPYIKSEEEKYQTFQQTVQQSIQQFESVKVEENKNAEVGLPPSAAILQNSTLEKTQKPPKVVRFVDEVENDLKNQQIQETPAPHQSSSVPEAESNTVSNPPEEEREQSGEEQEQEQEQKSFRKRRNYDSQDKPKSRSNNQRYGAGNGQRKNNYEQDTYHRGGRNSNSKYQYYYEKKSAE